MSLTSTPLLSEPALVLATHEYVKAYMAQFDSSHDYSHILRVLALSRKILAVSQQTEEVSYNPTIVTLLALLHDVGDKKYSPGTSPDLAGLGPAEGFLVSAGAEPEVAALVQKLINNVSFSHERANPELVAGVVKAHPELAIVQDADRLDAIGAVGVGRAFTFGAVKMPEAGMQGVIDHFDEKLLKLEEGMKTAEGKRLAKERGERIRAVRNWWRDETEGVEVS